MDYTELFQALITLLATIVTTFLIPYIKKKLSAEKTEELSKWISVAVKAAEQLYGGNTGTEKKEYVLSFLLDKGIIFDAAEVSAMIEAEVYKLTAQMNNK